MTARVPPEDVAVRILWVGAALVVGGVVFRLLLEILAAAVDGDSLATLVVVAVTAAVSLASGYAYREGVPSASSVREEVAAVGRLVDARDDGWRTFLAGSVVAVGGVLGYYSTLLAGLYVSPEVLVPGGGATHVDRLAAVLAAFVQTGCGMLVVGGVWLDWELLQRHRGSSTYSLGPDTLKSRAQERPVMSDEDAAVDTDAPDAGTDEGDLWARETAPQSPFTTREVGTGLLVFAVCAVVAFGLPLAVA